MKSQARPSPSIACLLITHLPIKAERCRYPLLRCKPLVIVESGGEYDVVLDCSAEAEGVLPGMQMGDALRVCPGAIVMQADAGHYGDVRDRTADAMRQRIGAVENAGPGCFYVNLPATKDGPGAPLFGEPQLIASLVQAAPPGFEPKVGVGPNRFVAYALAATARDGTAVKAPDDVASVLRHCSVDLLPLPDLLKLRLHRQGIHDLGQLTAASPGEVHAILGTHGRRARELACGIDGKAHYGGSLAAA